MQLTVLDSNGVPQTVLVPSLSTLVDCSGAIAATGTAQTLLAANNFRTGYFIQNNSANVLYINEMGGTATTTPVANNGSFVVQPGGTFPPPGYPVSTSAVSILGTVGSAFTAREW